MQQKNIINEGLVRVENIIGDNISVITVIYNDVYYTVDIRVKDEEEII